MILFVVLLTLLILVFLTFMLRLLDYMRAISHHLRDISAYQKMQMESATGMQAQQKWRA